MNAPHTIASRSRLDAALAVLPELARQIGEGAARREADRELPFEGFAKFRGTELGALRIPAARASLVEVIVTLAAADSSLSHALPLHYDVTEALRLSLRSASNDLQIERVLSGAIFGGALTERHTSRPGEVTSSLVREGDHFLASGRKYYSTGTLFSDYARINVQGEDDARVAIVIPVAREGLRIDDDWDGMGQRMTASGTLVLDQVRVEPDEVVERDSCSLVGRHGGALRQLHLVAVAAGIVRNVAADARRYVIEFGRPVLHSPAASAHEDHFIQQTVGELTAHSHAIDALVRENARPP
ncbi:MAG: acyl-CoA dehydrogenase, partial [Burkholderia gladioli]